MSFAFAADGTRIAYDVLGDGPPLLLISGQATDRSVWDRVRADFAAHHRVIRFDHRGTGLSDAPDALYSTRGFADDAIRVLDAANAPRAHVYGISMGGRIAQWLAIDHAARLGALILACTTPGNAHGIRRPADVDPILASGLPSRMLPFLVGDAWLAANPDALDDLIAVARDRPVPPHARRLHFAASEAHDAWELLPAISAPTLVLHGDDDRINVVANAHKLASRIPTATLHVLPGARHYYFWDHRPVASELVLDFMARHPL